MRTASGLILALTAFGWMLAGCRGDAPVTATPSPPWGAGSRTPHLALTPDGTPVLSWLEPTDDADSVALRHATYRNGAWHDATTVATGTDWFVNWADFPSVTPIDEQLWAAHWLVKRPGGTYAYDIAIALSHDGGATWSAPLTPHTDGTATEHGFVTLFPDGDGVGALWLDGRAMTPDGEHGDGGMTLRTARLHRDGRLVGGSEIDGLVCDCCQTDVAVTGTGPVAVYRNRTEAEVRDIYVARRIGGAWQPGAPVADDGWTIDGCPVNGPAITARGKRVAVAWFTAADDAPRVRVALSSDGGATFDAPVTLDQSHPVGRVDVAWGSDGAVLVSWLDSGDAGRGRVVVRALDRDGVPGDAHVIATTTAARASGFPQMLRAGGRVLFAWTEAENDSTVIRSTERPVDTL